MIINKKIFIGILLFYTIVIALTVPIAWNPTNNKIYVFPRDLSQNSYIVGVWSTTNNTPLIIVSKESTTRVYSANGQEYLIKGFSTLASCYDGNGTIVMAGARGESGYAVAILDARRGTGELWNLGRAGMPIACGARAGLIAVVLQDPIGGDKLAVINYEDNQGFLYALPRKLYYMSSVGVDSRKEIVLGGTNRYAILHQAGSRLDGTLYTFSPPKEDSIVKLTGVSILNNTLLLYGKIFVGGPQSLSYRAVILFPARSQLLVVEFGNADTLAWAAARLGGSYAILVEIKGSRLDIVPLTTEGKVIHRPVKITVLAPYVFDMATSQGGEINVLYTIYPVDNASSGMSSVLLLRDEGIGVLGANYTLAYIALGADTESPAVTSFSLNASSSNVTVGESRSLSVKGLAVESVRGVSAVEYGVIKDSRLLFCSVLAVFSAFVSAPVYFSVRASRPFSLEP